MKRKLKPKLKLRPEVVRFALLMEAKLRKHDKDRGDGWRSMYDEDIRERLDSELKELELVWFDRDLRKNEAADVANFLMFLTEKRRHLKRYR